LSQSRPSTGRLPPSTRPAGITPHYRIGVVARMIAAVGGGYAIAALSAACLAHWGGLPRGDAVALGMVASFAVMACVVVCVFAARSATRACVGVVVACALLFALLHLLR